MHLSRFVEALRADLAAVADVGDEATAEAAAKLSLALSGAIGLRLLDALTEASVELSAQLSSGHVEVRLVGQDPELVYIQEEADLPTAPGDDAFTARITLRLPESLKEKVETAAGREGVSTNTWIVRAISRTSSSGRRTENRLTGFARS